MLNIVIPMAGSGVRFAKAGFAKPKPFIDVNGAPMILRVMENIFIRDARYILICRSEHLAGENCEIRKLIEARFDCVFLPIEKPTEGAACTILHARQYFDSDDPLLLANSDQLVDIDVADFYRDCMERALDGSIMTFLDPSKDPKWSFARTGPDGYVIEVREKQPISENATVGIYLFRRGRNFVDGAIDMIVRNDRVNGEFYTCPVYNYLLRDNRKIGIYNIPAGKMHGLGTPEDLEKYLATGNSPRL